MKNKLKRQLALILALAMWLSLFSANVWAAESALMLEHLTISAQGKGGMSTQSVTGTCGDNLTWKLDSKGTLTIQGTGQMYDFSCSDPYELPWENYVNRIKKISIQEGVSSIGSFAFCECHITQLTIPSSVTRIGYRAFGFCESLKSVSISKGVKVIEGEAFTYCTKLTKVTIPKSVTSIEELVFAGCESLTSITIPESVKKIGMSAFADCKKLKTVTISSGVSKIGEAAFSDCKSLKSVAIPKSVTHIGKYAFGYRLKDNGFEYARKKDFLIRGKKKSAAQKYAKNNKFKFKAI